MNVPRILGFSGAAVLAIGAFLPIVNLPIVGQINYFNNGQGDGVFIILLALVAFLLVGLGKVKFLWLPGGISAVLLLVTLGRFSQLINEAKRNLEEALTGNPFAGLATGFVNSIQLQWGWMVLFLGSNALILASIISRRQKQLDSESETKAEISQI